MSDISIIIPTKDELNVKNILKDIKKNFKKNEIEIIIVDKSKPEIKRKIKDLGFPVIDQISNGYENALVEGFKRAKSPILATIDADGTYSVKDLKSVILELDKGDYDFISGDRSSGLRKMTFYISFGNKFLTKWFNFLYHRKMHDVLSGVFAMKREVFDKIKYDDAFRAGTLFFEIEAVRRGYRIKDIPISYADRVNTKSRITKSKPIYGFFIAFYSIKYARDYRPLVLFGAIGILLIIAGIIVGALVVQNYFATGALIEVGRALISFMLIVLGFLSIITGLILDRLLEIEKILLKK